MTTAIDDELFELLLLAFPPDDMRHFRAEKIDRTDRNACDVLILDWVIAAIVQKMDAEIKRRELTKS